MLLLGAYTNQMSVVYHVLDAHLHLSPNPVRDLIIGLCLFPRQPVLITQVFPFFHDPEVSLALPHDRSIALRDSAGRFCFCLHATKPLSIPIAHYIPNLLLHTQTTFTCSS
jgi:hypothetical protein